MQPVPWPVITPDRLEQLEVEALNPQVYNRQAKLLLFEYAVMYSALHLLPKLAALQFSPALRADSERAAIENKYSQDYQGAHPVLNQKIERYGVDFRNPLNQTPLMVAARLGREDLVRDLIVQGANTHALDNWGRAPLQIALRQAYNRPDYARSAIGGIYPLLAPSALKVRTGGRLVKLDSHVMEFFLLHSMVALFEDVVRRKVQVSFPAFETGDFVSALAPFPMNVIPEHRRRRPYLSSVLARNELHRNDPGNRHLFLRVSHGFYVPNPAMDIEIENSWINVCDLLHLDTMDEGAEKRLKDLLDVMRHVRKQGRLEDSSRLRFSPFYNKPVARTLPSIARRVRGEDVSWEDEWEGEGPLSGDAIPEIALREEAAVNAIPAVTPSEWQPEPETTAAAPPRHELLLADDLPDPTPVTEPSTMPSEPAPIDVPVPVPETAKPAPVLPLPAPSSESAPPQRMQAKSQPNVPRHDMEDADSIPPLPPLLDVAMPEYTQREKQLLRRFEFPLRPYPEADGVAVSTNLDRFRPALLDMVCGILDPYIKLDVIGFRRNYMGYIGAIYLLAGAQDQALLPLLLRVAINPGLARFHLNSEQLLDLPRALATVAPQDPTPIISLAAYPLSVASRCLILKTLAYLFFWKRTSREIVVQVLRQAFEAGIPASDFDVWDIVLDVCCAVHPREIMPHLRRQLSSAVCRELRISRANLENMNLTPMSVVVANGRAAHPGPIRGWEDFAKIVIDDDDARKEDIPEVEPIHAAPKVGRNDPCPCGSGRKFKKCCGA
jgi:hypothetical protein